MEVIVNSKLITALICAGFSFSIPSYASSSDCANAGFSSGLCAPKLCGGFYAGVTGYWLRPTGSGNDLIAEIQNHGHLNHENEHGGEEIASSDNSSNMSGSCDSEFRKFNPKERWAWEVKVGYDFPCTANSIELSYMHFSH